MSDKKEYQQKEEMLNYAAAFQSKVDGMEMEIEMRKERGTNYTSKSTTPDKPLRLLQNNEMLLRLRSTDNSKEQGI